MYDVVTILYDGFETLDVFGPVEILGRLPDRFSLRFYSMTGGVITSAQNVPVMTKPLSGVSQNRYILLVPGGTGIQNMITDDAFIAILRSLADNAEYILTICTGSILLSKTGILKGRCATTNKRLFTWTKTIPGVTWIQKARWVRDGSIYTSSGVSAGMDMALGFVSNLCGYPLAQQVSREIEYEWNEDSEYDPFCDQYGLDLV